MKVDGRTGQWLQVYSDLCERAHAEQAEEDLAEVGSMCSKSKEDMRAAMKEMKNDGPDKHLEV